MQAFPLSDGLWVSDVATGKGRLVVSLAQLREATTTGVALCVTARRIWCWFVTEIEVAIYERNC